MVHKSGSLWVAISLIMVIFSGCGDSAPVNSPFSSNWFVPKESDTLRFKWVPNRRLEYRFEIFQEVNFTSANETALSNLRITQAYAIDTGPSSGGDTTTIVLSFSDQLVSMKEGQSEGAYDSTKPNETRSQTGDFLERSIGQLVGEQIVLILGEGQEITRIEGLESLLEKITHGIPTNLQNMILSVFDEDRIRQLIYLTQLPPGKITRSQAWPIQETRQFGLLGQTHLDGTAKLQDTKIRDGHTLYQIQISGEARNSEGTKKLPTQPFVLSDGTFRGTAWFDSDLGQYADSILTHDLHLNFNSRASLYETDPADIHVIQKYSTKFLGVKMLDTSTSQR
jgi:hypothetical protein